VETKNKFMATNIYHIYSEYNKVTDEQSKKAMLEHEGYIVFHKWSNDMEGQRCIINIY
jgi:hypothetical protein